MITLAIILVVTGIVGILVLTSSISWAISWLVQVLLLFLILLLVVGVLMLLVKSEEGLKEKTCEIIGEQDERQ